MRAHDGELSTRHATYVIAVPAGVAAGASTYQEHLTRAWGTGPVAVRAVDHVTVVRALQGRGGPALTVGGGQGVVVAPLSAEEVAAVAVASSSDACARVRGATRRAARRCAAGVRP